MREKISILLTSSTDIWNLADRKEVGMSRRRYTPKAESAGGARGCLGREDARASGALRYEFAGRHNIRDMDTVAQMIHVVTGLIGKGLLYPELVGKT
ncbi:hypothetical protein [Candidatus Palauibacter polyketidifaciens]|uniref:hypothetical protein n=1 Tax=Candidatus Palauibacter polyketidifaciens TaxID=3056740 RepID=UPI00239ED920|nr:hypothetical protein [Candidatus Palauibacter polyketidifaciens]MDE2720712.1 hypothetical protein [Candidatus Palauibacter polyketidifaciens]